MSKKKSEKEKLWYEKSIIHSIIALLILPVTLIWYIWAKSKLSKIWKIVITILISLFCLGVIGAVSGDPSKPYNAESLPTNNNGEVLTNKDYQKLTTDPDKYKGYQVNITGKIFTDSEKGDGLITFQMWMNPEESEGNTAVAFTEDMDLSIDQYVRIKGVVTGKISGTNAFSGEISMPAILATSIEKVSAFEAVAPTIKSIKPNKTIDQYGLRLTIQKIEFAEKQTRAYVKIRNASGYKASVYSYDAKIKQGSKQYDEKSDFFEDYKELPGDLLNGTTASGIVIFEPINYKTKNCQIVITGSTDNYWVDFKPYTFNINW